MVTLYKFPRVWGLPCMSPYCLKVESYFRLVGVEYRTEVGDLSAAPRGQLPWVDVAGHRIGDSNLIIEHFEAQRERTLDAELTATERARGWSLMRTLEESTVWALRYQRFVEDSGWLATREVVRSILPAPLRQVGPALIRRGMRKALRAQGAGRHDAATIYSFAKRDLDVAAELLGDSPYLFGNAVTTFDLSLFGFVTSFACPVASSPVTDHLLTKPNLLAFGERLRIRLYPEFSSWVSRPAA
jgi:glutathione S-transferase